MVLKFYFQPYSTAEFTITVFAELEYGLAEPLAERIQLDLKKGESHTPEYLAEVNPNGLVPAIVHDGVSVWEAAAVTMYLGETFGVDRRSGDRELPGLYPPPGPRRGEAMKWLVWSSTHLAAKGSEVYKASSSGAESPESQKAMEELNVVVKVLDQAMEGKEYIVGETFSLVDAHLWSAFNWLGMMGLDLAPFKNIAAWKQKVGTRPALKALQ